MADAPFAICDYQGNLIKLAADLTLGITTPKVIATSGGTGASADQVQGNVAHDSPIAGNPVRLGGRALSALYAQVTAGDVADLITQRWGPLVTMPYSLLELAWQATVSVADANSTLLKAANASLRNYITNLQISPVATTVQVGVQILDGAAVMWAGNILAGAATIQIPFAMPLKGSVNTAINVLLSGAPTGAVQVSAQGFNAP